MDILLQISSDLKLSLHDVKKSEKEDELKGQSSYR